MEIFMIKNSTGTHTPAFDSDYENNKKIPVGDIVKHTITKIRNPRFHKKYFAMLNCFYHCLNESQMERYPNPDNFREAILIMTGHYVLTVLPDGTEHKKAKSISFASMDDIEFEKVYSDTLDTGLKWFLKGLTQGEFEQEIINFM